MTRLCNILYHANCLDGFASMVVAEHFLKERKYDVLCQPVNYNKPMPEMEPGSDVYIVDFSYSPAVIAAAAARYDMITILDHHDTAMQDWSKNRVPQPPHVYPYFHNDLSGVGMVWTHFSTRPMPTLLQHVQDRDLWRFALPRTKEINATLFSYGWTKMLHKMLMEWNVPERQDVAYQDLLCHDLYNEGVHILRAHDQNVLTTVESARIISIFDTDIPIVNCPPFLSSDVGMNLCKIHNAPMAICYIDNKECKRYFMLRSLKGGWHVGKFAKAAFGGGGHAHASGGYAHLDECGQDCIPDLVHEMEGKDVVELTFDKDPV